MKRIFSYITLLSFFFSPLAIAHDEYDSFDGEEEVFYTDEDEDLFNRGKFVGEADDTYARTVRRTKQKNWAIALGTTAIGVATLILASK